MRDLIKGARVLLLTSVSMYGLACDDASPSTTTTDASPEAGTGGDGGDGGGGDGGGGDGGGVNPTSCFGDDECEDDEYCHIEGEDLQGECREGCRDNSDCAEGEACVDHVCEVQPCADDGDCAADEICDLTQDPAVCVAVDCKSDDDCSLDEDGRSQECDVDTNTCVPLFPCCGADDTCSVGREAACDGTLLRGVNACDQVDCEVGGCEDDEDCGDDLSTFCNEDGACQLGGCRVGVAESCPDGQVCVEDKNSCEDVLCDEDEECPEGFFCDLENGSICRQGCREGSCPEGQICNDDHVCEDAGDPPCDPESENPCDPGEYCDEAAEVCREHCGDHADCPEEEACLPPRPDEEDEGGRCAVACRDNLDDEPNNDQENATVIELGMADADGFRFGSATQDPGRIACADVDFYQVDLNQAEIMRVQLNYAPADGNLGLRIHGDAVVDGPIAQDGLEPPEVIIYPPIGSSLDAATYYLEVFGGDATGVGYELSIIVADANNGCFPDDRDLAGEGDDDQDHSTVVDFAQGRAIYDGRVCRDDEDWFSFPMAANDGLSVNVTREDVGGDLQFQLYSEATLDRGALGQPDYASGDAEMVAAGTRWSFSADQDTGAFDEGMWFLRVRGIDAEAIAEYQLDIQVQRGAECMSDDGGTDEANNEQAGAVDLDQFPDITENGRLTPDEDHEVPIDLELCVDDRDWFCFTLRDGDGIETWANHRGVNDDITVSIRDDGGNELASANTAVGGEPGRANVANVVGDGRYCVRVDGVGGAQGPYDLFVRRTEFDENNQCANDPEGDNRNDTAATATELVGEGHYQADGLLCLDDQDWYSFDVSEAARICVTLRGFDSDVADADIELYNAGPRADPCIASNNCIPCVSTADCEADAAGECVSGSCRAPVETGTKPYDVELVASARSIVNARGDGPHVARIIRGDDNDENVNYNLSIDIVDNVAECAPDALEPDAFNDVIELGDAHQAFCGRWLCIDEQNNLDRDFYSFRIPAGQDRTVMVCGSREEGRLSLDYDGPPHPDAQADPFDAGYRQSQEGQQSCQCINVRGGNEDALANIEVGATDISDDEIGGIRNKRLDYELYIVPTDLDDSPAGACAILGAADLDSCPEDPSDEELLMRGCWPKVRTP